MDEQQIQEKLAQNLPKSEPDLNPQYPEPEEQTTNTTNLLPLADSLLTNEVSDYFGFGSGAKHNVELQTQFQEILAWAKSNAESQDLPGILRVLRHTETILGSQLKPDRFARIYRYVRIQQQKALIAERERDLYI